MKNKITDPQTRDISLRIKRIQVHCTPHTFFLNFAYLSTRSTLSIPQKSFDVRCRPFDRFLYVIEPNLKLSASIF